MIDIDYFIQELEPVFLLGNNLISEVFLQALLDIIERDLFHAHMKKLVYHLFLDSSKKLPCDCVVKFCVLYSNGMR